MPALLLPATANRSKSLVNVFLSGAEDNPNGENYVLPLSALAPGSYTNAPTVDDTFGGPIISGFNAAVNLAQWDAVYLNSSGAWALADANLTGAFPARGLVIAATLAGAPALIVTGGVVRNDAWNWTIGSNIYLSDSTAGGLNQNPPTQNSPAASSNTQAIGWAVSADVAIFNFTPTFRPIWDTTYVGNATLVAGTVTVVDTKITANSVITLSRKTIGGTLGTGISYTITAGTGYTITSNSATETSVISVNIVY